MFGLALGLLEDKSLEESILFFNELRNQFPIEVCEIHGEASLYKASCRMGSKQDLLQIFRLRQDVKKLGLHLPFMSFNPVSQDYREREGTMSEAFKWFKYASEIEADYTVVHLRSNDYDADGKREETDQSRWVQFIEGLAEKASECNVELCIENADDMRDFDKLIEITDEISYPVKFCLDIGHLYERIYPSSRVMSKILRVNDKYSPFSFVLGKNLPAKTYDGWQKILEVNRKNIGSIHIHNHDGRTAHKPLSMGKINFESLKTLSNKIKDIPLVIEADYRCINRDIIIRDLKYIEELLSLEK